jgi:dGTPase
MAGDFRTQAEHDCDRILYSSAYRRLAGITQVVAVNELQLFTLGSRTLKKLRS